MKYSEEDSFDPDAPPPPLSTVRRQSSSMRAPPHTDSGRSLRTSLRGSIKTMTFLRGIMGQRNQDYVSDQPQTYNAAATPPNEPWRRSLAAVPTGAEASPADTVDVTSAGAELRVARQRCVWRALTSRVYGAFVVIATLILLVGAQVRDLLPLTPVADAWADCVVATTLTFLLTDVALRLYAEPGYWKPHKIVCCGGSFLFWCELVSTLTLLRELSFLDLEGIFGEQEVKIDLNEWGMPENMRGRGNINESSPVEYNALELLAVIAKSTHVARFIRSSAAVELSSRFQRLWICQHLSCGSHRRREEHPQAFMQPSEVLSLTLDKRKAPKERRHNASWKTSLSRKLVWLGKKDDGEADRNRAASQIQRAWRKHSRHSMEHGDSRPTRRNQEDDEEEPLRQRGNESQVGSAMRELTGQRVAIGILVALVVSALLTYQEKNASRPTTMIVLHSQMTSGVSGSAFRSLEAARASSVPDLYVYTSADGAEFTLDDTVDHDRLRPRERLRVTVTDAVGKQTVGLFEYRNEVMEEALVSLLSTIFVLFVWFFGVTSFAGPVMILVVIPIERMVRLLGMLMLDPLGYQSSRRYKRFVAEEDELTKNTHWTKEVLKGMETSFLMSTILRIGNLMQVGFGSAGVEIIRNNLQKGQTKNQLMLSEQGSTVSCIFLFSDIRQFTDATECLQEEVFVFTNRIAAVVHSICHSYGGSANKNIGDAFLLSWQLDESNSRGGGGFGRPVEKFTAKFNQADKALLSVVKICMALHHDDYYVETMSEAAREALLSKLSKRTGPIVQMGFGLHAGTAVQGAIGSTRKIDATYVSEAVERAEYLESSTKKYGLKMLMSDSFHTLLHPSNRRRCRKIDQIIIRNDEDDEECGEDGLPVGDTVELFTFDMDIDALWKSDGRIASKSQRSEGYDSDSDVGSQLGSTRFEGRRKASALGIGMRSQMLQKGKRRSVRLGNRDAHPGAFSDDFSDGTFLAPGPNAVAQQDNTEIDSPGPPELVLPTGPALYNANCWVDEDMRRMRQRYIDGLFFHNFNAGLQSYYSKDWEHAKQCFENILDRFEDGPSRYYLNLIEKSGGKAPRNFLPYAIE